MLSGRAHTPLANRALPQGWASLGRHESEQIIVVMPFGISLNFGWLHEN
jgi:hypothetical protein